MTLRASRRSFRQLFWQFCVKVHSPVNLSRLYTLRRTLPCRPFPSSPPLRRGLPTFRSLIVPFFLFSPASIGCANSAALPPHAPVEPSPQDNDTPSKQTPRNCVPPSPPQYSNYPPVKPSMIYSIPHFRLLIAEEQVAFHTPGDVLGPQFLPEAPFLPLQLSPQKGGTFLCLREMIPH